MATRTLTVMANAAAQFLGVLDSGAALSSQQVADCLAAANDMIDNWSTEQTLILQALLLSTNCIVSTQSYALGTRAVKIVAAHNVLAAGPSNEIKVVSAEEWAAIPNRQSTSYLISYLFYDRGSPTGTFYVSDIPVASSGSIQIMYWAALSQFVDATTALTLLPGYAELMTLGLTRLIASQFDFPIPESVEKNYTEALERVRQLNAGLFGVPTPAGK